MRRIEGFPGFDFKTEVNAVDWAKLYLFRRPSREAINNRWIAVTSDDGPYPQTALPTVRMLTELAMPTTFFWIEEHTRLYRQNRPDEFRELLSAVDEGRHTIGWHSINDHHLSLISRMRGPYDADAIRRSIRRFEEIVDREVTHARPHYGQFGPLLSVANEMGIDIIGDWQHMPIADASVGKQLARIARVGPGGMLLFHDGVSSRRSRTNMLAVLPHAALLLRQKGLEVRSIPHIYPHPHRKLAV